MIHRKYEHITLFLNGIFNNKVIEEITSSLGYIIHVHTSYNQYYVFTIDNNSFFTNSDIYDSKKGLKRFFDFLSYKWVFFNMTNKDWFYVKDNNFASSKNGSDDYYYFKNDTENGIIYKDWSSFKEFMSK